METVVGPAELLDDPDEVVARHERERRLRVVLPAAQRLLRRRHARGLDPDARLPGLERRELPGHCGERLRLARSVNTISVVSMSVSWARVFTASANTVRSKTATV